LLTRRLAEQSSRNDYYKCGLLRSPRHEDPGQANLSSDTPDTNLDNNVLSYEFLIAPLPRIISVRALSNPFRIEITGQNLFVPKFVGIGIGCDCHDWPAELVHKEGENVIFSGGSELKRQFPKGVPVQICYVDEVRGMGITTTFTRGSQ
jgi:hypothetical protein